ncbi:DNA-binding transcriptional regulator YdaS (Cro superfamily) [Cupriavidus metallidurans]|uniref:YdaS family helix-turn-helix protein n=1 Tax=Cupriavidus metallidurans TaxID=119219 RepID=UPI0004935591|nr:YdaS family helix-turn-helix protein [Cupriavidus metallidurans]MDE4918367.1 YdaS family helix-turn-helix protein [Cupriavidus metallidurans]
METTRSEELRRAIEDAGGAVAVATLLDVSRHAIYDYIRRGRVPAEHCPTIERHCSGRVRCEVLNPSVDWNYLREHSAHAEPAAA